MPDRRTGIDLGPEGRRHGFRRVNPRWVQGVMALLIVIIASFIAGAQWQWQKERAAEDAASPPCPFYEPQQPAQHISA